jgi:hypothetical protein
MEKTLLKILDPISIASRPARILAVRSSCLHSGLINEIPEETTKEQAPLTITAFRGLCVSNCPIDPIHLHYKQS